MTPLIWTIVAAEIPENGLVVARAATPEECRALTAALDIVDTTRVDLKCRLQPRGGGRYRLAGTLRADVAQACVVTLDPVAAKLDIPLELELVPEDKLPSIGAMDADEDGPDDADAPLAEPIRNGVIDLGEIVFQEISAALDPYPRAADAALDRTEAGPPDDERTNPFAKLQALRKEPKG